MRAGRLVDRNTRKHLTLHLIADNYATHNHPEVWLAVFQAQRKLPV